MNDYVKAALYTVLFFAGIVGFAAFLGLFPMVSIVVLGSAAVGLMFYSILTSIRSKRTIDEIRARYE